MQELTQAVTPMIPALRRYARALLRDAAAADDLVQDCLERVVSHWHRRRDVDARSWVFAILHNLAMSALRAGSRRGPHLPLDDVGEEALAARPTQEDGLRLRDLLDALERLPAEQRSVLLLVSVEDMSYAQAAEVLGIPVGTVMSRLARGREKLLRLTQAQESMPGHAAQPGLRRIK